MDPKKSKNSSPRIKVIQKLYNALMNPDASIEYPKSRYKKFIKDVVSGTIDVVCVVVGQNTNLEFWYNRDNASAARLDADDGAYVSFTVTYFAT